MEAMKRPLTRVGIIALTLCLLGALLTAPALADGVWSPAPSNNFFELHKDACVPVNMTFVIPGEEEPSLKTRPGSHTEVESSRDYESFKAWVQQNGYSVSHVYNYKGELWGYVYGLLYGPGGGGAAGWILLDGAALAYSSDFFLKEYRAQLYAYPGDREQVVQQLESAEVVYWKWPCSGKRETHFISIEGLMLLPEPEDLQDVANYDFSNMFRDEQGREWVYFSCYAVWGWICLDDPSNPSMPTTIDNPQPFTWDPKDYPQVMSSTLKLAIALVGFVVLTSLALILILNRRKKGAPRA